MLKRVALLFLVLFSLAVWPASACAKCKMQLVCQPNCELVEFCTPNQFGEAGFECQDTIWGCNLGGRCFWVDLHTSSPAQAPFQVADSCKLSVS